jgi:hypothetical protein
LAGFESPDKPANSRYGSTELHDTAILDQLTRRTAFRGPSAHELRGPCGDVMHHFAGHKEVCIFGFFTFDCL